MFHADGEGDGAGVAAGIFHHGAFCQVEGQLGGAAGKGGFGGIGRVHGQDSAALVDAVTVCVLHRIVQRLVRIALQGYGQGAAAVQPDHHLLAIVHPDALGLDGGRAAEGDAGRDGDGVGGSDLVGEASRAVLVLAVFVDYDIAANDEGAIAGDGVAYDGAVVDDRAAVGDSAVVGEGDAPVNAQAGALRNGQANPAGHRGVGGQGGAAVDLAGHGAARRAGLFQHHGVDEAAFVSLRACAAAELTAVADARAVVAAGGGDKAATDGDGACAAIAAADARAEVAAFTCHCAAIDGDGAATLEAAADARAEVAAFTCHRAAVNGDGAGAYYAAADARSHTAAGSTYRAAVDGDGACAAIAAADARAVLAAGACHGAAVDGDGACALVAAADARAVLAAGGTYRAAMDGDGAAVAGI